MANKRKAKVIRSSNSGKVVAYVDGDTLKKIIKGSKHILRNPPAICFDMDVMVRARELGAVNVVVRDRETDTDFHSTVDAIMERGFPINRGHGNQIAMLIDYWVVENMKQEEMFA